MVTDPPHRTSGPQLAATVLAPLLLAACVAPVTGPHEMLNAALWQQHAAEYRALAIQSYRLAEQRLREGLASGWSAALEQTADASGLPPAVLLDLDETVLSNARYEARVVTHLGVYSRESFARWCQEGGASAVPGAVDFVAAARSLGVTVLYYTAREARLRECTARTLEALGLAPAAPEHLLLRDAGSKHAIRMRLASRYRLVLLVGDNLEDFVDGSKASPAERGALAERHAERFGERWILLPNAVYGHWEAAWYGFDYEQDREAMIDAKVRALEP